MSEQQEGKEENDHGGENEEGELNNGTQEPEQEKSEQPETQKQEVSKTQAPKPQGQAQAQTAGGLFVTGPTKNTSGGLFGAQASKESAGGLFGAGGGNGGGGLFGGSAPKEGLFGNVQAYKPSTGLFGGGSSPNTTKEGVLASDDQLVAAKARLQSGTGGLFGNSTTNPNPVDNTTVPSGGGGLFGNSTANLDQVENPPRLFGGGGGGLFGNSSSNNFTAQSNFDNQTKGVFPPPQADINSNQFATSSIPQWGEFQVPTTLFDHTSKGQQPQPPQDQPSDTLPPIQGTQMTKFQPEVKDKLTIQSYNAMPGITPVPMKLHRLKDYNDIKAGRIRPELVGKVQTYFQNTNSKYAPPKDLPLHPEFVNTEEAPKQTIFDLKSSASNVGAAPFSQGQEFKPSTAYQVPHGQLFGNNQPTVAANGGIFSNGGGLFGGPTRDQNSSSSVGMGSLLTRLVKTTVVGEKRGPCSLNAFMAISPILTLEKKINLNMQINNGKEISIETSSDSLLSEIVSQIIRLGHCPGSYAEWLARAHLLGPGGRKLSLLNTVFEANLINGSTVFLTMDN